MNKVSVLVFAAAMGIISAAFAANAATTNTPAMTAQSKTTVKNDKAKQHSMGNVHHNKHKNAGIKQKAQASKKHGQKKIVSKPAVAVKHNTPVKQKAQAAKKHHKNIKHMAKHAARTAVRPAA